MSQGWLSSMVFPAAYQSLMHRELGQETCHIPLKAEGKRSVEVFKLGNTQLPQQF